MKTELKILDANQIRKDFPILSREMNGKPLVYLDNAATTHKPNVVIERVCDFYRNENATVSRGVYELSHFATTACNQAREKCQNLLNAKQVEEIIFVRGTTEAINLVASGYGRKFLNAGDEIILSTIEHHANIVPWKRLSEEKDLTIKVIPVNDQGELILEEYKKLLTTKTKLVAITHISNALGTINPIKKIIALAHEKGAHVLVDGAQAIPHLEVDVQDLDCDFYCFSGHKIYAPTGIGILYGKLSLLEAMDPYQGGGEMINSVSFQKITYAKPPRKFEAGTIAIAQVIGLGLAIDYIQHLGISNIETYEHELLEVATQKLSTIEDLKIIGTAAEKSTIISFTLKDIHPHDIGTFLDQEGIAVRVGHHCAQPTMERFKVPATVRASFSFYNTKEEIDKLVQALKKVKEFFK